MHRNGSAACKITFTGTEGTLEYGAALPAAVGYPSRASRFVLSLWISGAAHRDARAELIESGGAAPQRIAARKTLTLNGNWQRIKFGGTVKNTNRSSLTVTVLRLKTVGRRESFYIDAVSLLALT